MNRWTDMRCEATLHIGDKTEIITDGDLIRYADGIGLNRVAKDRCSCVFVLDLLLHERFLGVESWGIVQEIRALEQGRCGVGTKPASQFLHEPLRGLWHKHYFCARFVAQNMLNQLAGGRIEAVVKKTLGANPPVVITEQIANQLAHRLNG
ncbi:MAG: hypothetical protein ACHQ4J_00200 [Candidatus Binatia bacterium]